MRKCYCRLKVDSTTARITKFVIGLVILFSGQVSALAEASSDSTQKKELSVQFDGTSYSVTLYFPSTKNDQHAYPLIIVASGVGNNLHRFIRATEFPKMVNARGFAVAFFKTDEHDDWVDWINSGDAKSNKAAGFIRTVIKIVARQSNIQLQKIYLAGFSGGGMLTLAAMCDLSQEIAAFGVVAASLPVVWQSQCVPKRSVPAIIITSRDDPVVPWDGGRVTLTGQSVIEVLSISDTVDLWRSNNKCNSRPTLEPLANVDPTDGTTVTRMNYDYQCLSNLPVLLYAISRGSHSWPGSIVKLSNSEGAISQDIQASTVIWEFVRQYSLGH